MPCTRHRYPYSWSRSQLEVEGHAVKLCRCEYSYTPEVHLKVTEEMKQNENLCHVQDLGSMPMFKVTTRVQRLVKGLSGAFVKYCNISC